MKDKDYSVKNLVTLQTYGWYFILIYFGCAVAIDALQIVPPFEIGKYGILLIILIIILNIIVIAEKFRQLNLRRYAVLSYSLILILGLTIIVRLFQ